MSVDINSMLASKLHRSPVDIINSVKKRRSRSHDRLRGRALDMKEEEIISECKRKYLNLEGGSHNEPWDNQHSMSFEAPAKCYRQSKDFSASRSEGADC